MANNKLIKILKSLLLLYLVLILIGPFSLAYKMSSPDRVVHQYITNESGEVWSLIPYEIKTRLSKDIANLEIDENYDIGDDIITGSGEEDKALSTVLNLYRNHYWDPDAPNYISSDEGDYSKGLWLMESNRFVFYY